jgi:hypothetical protein
MQTENHFYKLWKIIKSRDRALERAREVIQEFRQREQETSEAWNDLQNYNKTLEAALAEKTVEIAEKTVEIAEKNRLLSAEKDLVQYLQDQLQSIEIVRSQLIDELHQSNHQLHQANHQLHQANHQLHQSNHQLHQSNHQLHQEIERFKQEAAHLNHEIAFLSTNKAAARKLIKTFLNKFKLYNFIYRKYSFFVPIYNFIFRDKWKPSTIYRPLESATNINLDSEVINSELSGNNYKDSTENKSKNAHVKIQRIDMASPTVEAFLIHREFDENIDFNSLELISGIIDDFRNVLCVNPCQQVLPLLQILSQNQVKVTCVDCKDTDFHLCLSQFEISSLELGDWMVTAGKTHFWDYDALLINSSLPKEMLMMIQGRLSPKTKLLVNGTTLNNDLEGEAPYIEIKGLQIYKSPPTTWIDPVWQDGTAEQLLWPWNYKHPVFPSTLPSGKPWPKISVVTVTFNQGAYIEETLRSVLLQGYPNLEYIVIDGGSNDNTLTILKRYQSELAYWVSEPDRGQSHALNKGFSQATGDILAWLNSDDRYLPDTLFRVALAFDTYGTDIIAGGCLLTQGNNPTPIKTHHNAMPVGKVVPLPLESLLNIDECWQQGQFFYQPEVFWTREIWERAGSKVDETLFYSLDYELWLRMAHCGASIVHIPDPLTVFRFHEEQKTHGSEIPYLPELKEVSAKFRREVLGG